MVEIGAARLTVVLDVRYPLAALALRPTLDLAREMSLDVDWLPLAVPPLKAPGAPGADDDRGTRHRRYRAEAIAREIETYSAAQGVVLRDWYRDGSAEAAHLAWLWTRDRHRASLTDLLVDLFDAYGSSELDASSIEDVAARVAAHTGSAEAFVRWARSEGPPALEAVEARLRTLGLASVPAFIVEDEVFLGRQHLPMIRWLLEGRVGPPPI